jgi:hypothetical protein
MQLRGRAMLPVLISCSYLLGLVLALAVRHAESPGGSQRQSSAAATGAGRAGPRVSTGQPKGRSAGASQRGYSAFLPGPGTLAQTLEAKLGEMRRNWPPKGVVQLFPMFFGLSSSEFPAVWALVKDLPTGRWGGWQGLLSGRLFRAWALKDPYAALAAASGRPGLTETALGVWARSDPNAALGWVLKGPEGTQRDRFLGSVIGGMAQREPASAAALLTNLPPGEEKSEAALEVVSAWAGTDPVAAGALLSDIHVPLHHSLALQSLAAGRADQSVSDALAWARSLTTPDDRRTALDAVVSRLAVTDPRQAAELVTRESDPALAADMAKSLAGLWAAVDEQAAMAWVAGLPAGALRQAALKALDDGLSLLDPLGGARFALEALPQGDARRADLVHAGVQLGFFPDDVGHAAACDWLSSLPSGADRDALISGFCERHPLPDEELAPLAASMTPGPDLVSTVQRLTQSWVNTAPVQAADWGSSLPEGLARSTALAAVAQSWGASDAASTAQWVGSLPPDPARDSAVEGFVRATSSNHPERAVPLLGLISDNAQRQQTTTQVLNNWMQTDPQAAQAWAKAVGIAPGQ